MECVRLAAAMKLLFAKIIFEIKSFDSQRDYRKFAPQHDY